MATYGEVRKQWEEKLAEIQKSEGFTDKQLQTMIGLLMRSADACYEVREYEIQPLDGSSHNSKFFLTVGVGHRDFDRHLFFKMYSIGPRGGVSTWDGERWLRGPKHTWRSVQT